MQKLSLFLTVLTELPGCTFHFEDVAATPIFKRFVKVGRQIFGQKMVILNSVRNNLHMKVPGQGNLKNWSTLVNILYLLK